MVDGKVPSHDGSYMVPSSYKNVNENSFSQLLCLQHLHCVLLSVPKPLTYYPEGDTRVRRVNQH